MIENGFNEKRAGQSHFSSLLTLLILFRPAPPLFLLAIKVHTKINIISQTFY